MADITMKVIAEYLKPIVARGERSENEFQARAKKNGLQEALEWTGIDVFISLERARLASHLIGAMDKPNVTLASLTWYSQRELVNNARYCDVRSTSHMALVEKQARTMFYGELVNFLQGGI